MNLKKILLVIVLIFVAFCATRLNPHPRMHIPIDLSEAGGVAEFEVKIRRNTDYDLTMLFPNPRFKDYKDDATYKQEHDKMFEFAGWQSSKGAIIPLQVTIHKINKDGKELIIDRTYIVQNAHSYGDNDLRAEIAYYDFKKGRYLIRVENLRGFEFMRDKVAKIYFGKYSRKV